MADIATALINENGFSENIANKYLTFEQWLGFTINSGTGLIEAESQSPFIDSNIYLFNGQNALKITNLDYKVTDLVFSTADSRYSFNSNAPQNFFVSAYVMNPTPLINTTLRLDIFQDAAPYNTLVFNLTDANMPDEEKYYRFGQIVNFNVGYTYTFKWTLVKDASSVATSKTVYVSGFAIQSLNEGSDGLPLFSEAKKQPLQWQARTDTVNTQSLTLATENLFGFTGTTTSNTQNELLSSSGLITPTKRDSVLVVDYAFTLTTPSGSDQHVDISLIVDGVTYRANTALLIKGSGNLDYISGSWALTVGSDLFDNGAEIFINPTSTCNITNRYLQVVEHSN